MHGGHWRTLRVSLTTIAVATFVSAAPTGATPTSKPAPLRIVVTNDDGYAAPGIDALVEALRDLPRVKITVVAPAANQSGTGDRTTPGPVGVAEVETASGFRASAVEGYPADSVVLALDNTARDPHLVISGVNQGQNLGPVLDVSGTVGAARTAARRGVPALAVSQGLGEPPDYAAGAAEAVTWVKEHRTQLARRDVATTEVVNINVPTCTTGEVRGLVDVPAATTGDALAPSDCTSTLADPPDDVVPSPTAMPG